MTFTMQWLYYNPVAADRQETWNNWRSSVNMSVSELERFLDQYGDVAGLSRAQAKAEGVRSGRDSARAIVRMIRKGGRSSYSSAESNWTRNDWDWAKRQVSFIARMQGTRGPLYTKNGKPTRKLLALKLWGHDPEK